MSVSSSATSAPTSMSARRVATSKAACIRPPAWDSRAYQAIARELPMLSAVATASPRAASLTVLGLGYGKLERGHPVLAQWTDKVKDRFASYEDAVKASNRKLGTPRRKPSSPPEAADKVKEIKLPKRSSGT